MIHGELCELSANDHFGDDDQVDSIYYDAERTVDVNEGWEVEEY